MLLLLLFLYFLASLWFVNCVYAYPPLAHTSIPYKDQTGVKGPKPEKWGHPTIIDCVMIRRKPILGLLHPLPQQGP